MKYSLMSERREGPGDPMPKSPSPLEDGGGPRRPETGSPDKDSLLKRMRRDDIGSGQGNRLVEVRREKGQRLCTLHR